MTFKFEPIAPSAELVAPIALVVNMAGFLGGRVNLSDGKIGARSLYRRFPSVTVHDVVMAGVLSGAFVSGDGRNVLTLAAAAELLAKSKANGAKSADAKLEFVTELYEAREEAYLANVAAREAALVAADAAETARLARQ